MKIATRYVCEICGSEYLSEAEALRCENQSEPRPHWKVGDKAWVTFRRSSRRALVEIVAVHAEPYDGLHRWKIAKTPDYMTRDSDHYDPNVQGYDCFPEELERV